MILDEILHRSKISRSIALNASILGSLGYLAHSGVAFTIIGVSCFLIFFKITNLSKNLSTIALSLLVFILVLSPWIVYQKIYDPPGNRLLKVHFAGETQYNEFDDRSTIDTIIDSYKDLTWQETAANKLLNLKTIAGFDKVSDSAIFTTDARLIEVSKQDELLIWRTAEREFVFRSLGLLNIAWLFLINWRKKPDVKQSRNDINSFSSLTIFLGISGLITASLLLFGAGATVTTHISYADVILLMFGLAARISTLNHSLISILLISQLIYFSVVWIFTTPPLVPNFLGLAFNFPVLFLGSVLFFILLSTLWGFYQTSHDLVD